MSLYIGRFTIIYFVSTLLFSSFYATFLFTLTPTFINLAKLTSTQPLDTFLFILTLTFLDNDPLNISYPYRLLSIDYKSSFNSLPSTIPTSNKNPTSLIRNTTKQKLSHRNLFLKTHKPQKNLQALHLKSLDSLYIFIDPHLKNK